MDLTTLSLNDLKALDWDQIRIIDQANANRQVINQEINKRMQAPVIHEPEASAPEEKPVTVTE